MGGGVGEGGVMFTELIYKFLCCRIDQLSAFN